MIRVCVRLLGLLVLFGTGVVHADKPSFTRSEVIYGRKFGMALTMDVIKPAQPNGAAIIWVISGGWFSSHDAIHPEFLGEFLKHGYTIFAVVHGSQPKFTIPEAVADMNRSVRFIRSHAHDYGIDPERIGVTGGSAGGHLSLMLGAAGNAGNPSAQDPVERASSRVQAVACFFPPTDFLNYGKKGKFALGFGTLAAFRAPFDFRELDTHTHAYERILDPQKILQIARDISPIYHIDQRTAPTLIVHGNADNLVPIEQSERFIGKLKEAGVPAKLVVKQGAGHGWPGMDKDLPAMADWFDKYLGKSHARADWPQFRGPGARGVADGSSTAETWSRTQNVVWKIDVPGRGWSSPVVWGDRMFLTSVVRDGKSETPRKGLYFGGERLAKPKDMHRWLVLCIDWSTGRTLWQREAYKGAPMSTHHVKNSYASETPVTDGQRVYAYFGNVGVFCYDMAGKLVWSHRLKPHATRFGWGTASSPVLDGDRLYIVNDNQDHSYLLALDRHTGKTVWKVDRDEKSNWSTPFVWHNPLRTEIVTAGSGQVRSYDLSGKELWHLKGMSSITIATPFAADGLLYISSGYVANKLRPIYAIRPGAAGDISLKDATHNSSIAWCQKTAAPYNPSTLVYGRYLYVLKDRGFLSCYEAASGKEVYADQRLGANAFTASPWADDGKVYCLSEDGETFVIQAGPKFKLLSKNKLDEMTLATPAALRGNILVRTESHLYRIGTRSEQVRR